MDLVFEESLIAHVAGQCETSEAGARNIDYLLQSRILPEISRELIGRLVEGTLEGPVRVGMAPDGRTLLHAGSDPHAGAEASGSETAAGAGPSGKKRRRP